MANQNPNPRQDRDEEGKFKPDRANPGQQQQQENPGRGQQQHGDQKQPGQMGQTPGKDRADWADKDRGDQR